MDTYFYFSRWFPNEAFPGLTKATAFRFLILVFLFLAVWRYAKSGLKFILPLVFVYAVYECGQEFWQETKGAALFKDDHPSFMFRLWMFGEIFPKLICYNPFWNAGQISYYMIPSGALIPGILLWPLWSIADVEQVYTPALMFFYLLFVPGLVAVSVRLVGGSWSAAHIGALLGLAVTREHFLWLLHYGTLGYTLSMPLLLLAIALLCGALKKQYLSWGALIALVISSVLYLCWPAGIIFGIPLLIALALNAKLLNRELCGRGLVAAVLIGLCMLPLVLAMQHHSRLSDLSALSHHHRAVSSVLVDFGMQLLKGHPLILCFGLFGVFFLEDKIVRRFFVPMILGLLIFTAFGDLWKPQYEVKRAALALFYVGAIPAALYIDDLFKRREKLWAVPSAIAISLLVVTGMSASRFYANQCLENYNTLRPYMQELKEWVGNNTESNERLMFAGPTRHAYGGGHVAYLAKQMNRELFACDYYAFSERLTDYEFPPLPYRNTQQGVAEYVQLYDIDYAISYHRDWVYFFRKNPDLYQETAKVKAGERTVVLFKIKTDSTRFYEGSGQVQAALNKINVTLDNAQQRAVIKYHWVDNLVVDTPASIAPFEVGKHRFIAIEPNGMSEVKIRHEKWF